MFLYYYKYWLILVKLFHDLKKCLYLSAFLKTYKLNVIQDMIKTQQLKVKSVFFFFSEFINAMYKKILLIETINAILENRYLYLLLPSSCDCKKKKKKECKLVECHTGHVVQDNLSELEINLFHSTNLI